jgi:hypothetical protein
MSSPTSATPATTPAEEQLPFVREGGEFVESDAEATLGGARCRVHIEMGRSLSTIASFTWRRTPYQFHLDTWSAQAFRGFVDLFFARGRDPLVYGTMTDDEGYHGTPTQRINCVLRATLDVFERLGALLQRFPTEILDFAVWYGTKPHDPDPEFDTYTEFLTRETCRCIRRASFTSGAASPAWHSA